MGLKTLLIWTFILGDLFLLIWLIEFVGLKNVGEFMVYYMISIVLSTILFGLLGIINPSDWEKTFKKNLNKKKNNLKLIGVLIIIVIGVLLSKTIPPYLTGMVTGSLVVLYMGIFTREFLYSLSQLVRMLEDTARKKYKWLK